jgi:hypothetical protein
METPMKMEYPASETPAGIHSTPEPSSLTPAGSIGTKTSMSPSPKSATSGHTPLNNAASKRPPRKSTLTQQQKNQKRQRATQDQLTTLEQEFNKNPTPTATVRERIADEINMTERSVQIWVQNRRAKIKLLAKKSLETGEDIDSIPESMRQYLAMQAMESGKGLSPFFGRTGLLPYGHQGMMMGGEQGGQGKVLIHHLTCRSLSIGTWTRVGQNTMDLIIFYSPDKCTMTYYINNDQAGYKIEYPFAYIKNIFLDQAEGDPNKIGGIFVELNRPPRFFMDSSPSTTGFFECGDFTEDQQASKVLTHHLGGNPKVLSGQLAKLVSLEAFMHRHTPNPMLEQFQAPALSVSAPVSPTHRPSSQPNFGQPPPPMFQEPQWPGMHPGMMMRAPGHKRQRSRSVPAPIDFNMLNTPSFYITQPPHDQQHGLPGPQPPQIFSPMPQQPNMLGIGPNLRIDTQAAGFGMDMRQYPMSATTAPSPAEFPPSPNYFASQAPDSAPMPASALNTPYSGTFSPMVNPAHGLPQSVSPLSFGSQHEPAIVTESPPFQDASGDMYGHESAVSEDGALNDMYQKHTLSLPLHPASPFDTNTSVDGDLNQFMTFESHDSLSPESVHH